MDKIEISFLPPLSIMLNLKKTEIIIEEPISLEVLEQKLISTFPDIKKSIQDLNNLIYFINDVRVFDKSITIAESSKVKLMMPLAGG